MFTGNAHQVQGVGPPGPNMSVQAKLMVAHFPCAIRQEYETTK